MRYKLGWSTGGGGGQKNHREKKQRREEAGLGQNGGKLFGRQQQAGEKLVKTSKIVARLFFFGLPTGPTFARPSAAQGAGTHPGGERGHVGLAGAEAQAGGGGQVWQQRRHRLERDARGLQQRRDGRDAGPWDGEGGFGASPGWVADHTCWAGLCRKVCWGGHVPLARMGGWHLISVPFAICN